MPDPVHYGRSKKITLCPIVNLLILPMKIRKFNSGLYQRIRTVGRVRSTVAYGVTR